MVVTAVERLIQELRSAGIPVERACCTLRHRRGWLQARVGSYAICFHMAP